MPARALTGCSWSGPGASFMLCNRHFRLWSSLLPLLFQCIGLALVYLANQGPESGIELVFVLDVLSDTKAFLKGLIQLLILLLTVSLHGVMSVEQSWGLVADLLSHWLTFGNTLDDRHRWPLANETIKHSFGVCLCLCHIASLGCITLFLKNSRSLWYGLQITIIIFLSFTPFCCCVPWWEARGYIKGRCPKLWVIVLKFLLQVLDSLHEIWFVFSLWSIQIQGWCIQVCSLLRLAQVFKDIKQPLLRLLRRADNLGWIGQLFWEFKLLLLLIVRWVWFDLNMGYRLNWRWLEGHLFLFHVLKLQAHICNWDYFFGDMASHADLTPNTNRV